MLACEKPKAEEAAALPDLFSLRWRGEPLLGPWYEEQ